MSTTNLKLTLRCEVLQALQSCTSRELNAFFVATPSVLVVRGLLLLLHFFVLFASLSSLIFLEAFVKPLYFTLNILVFGPVFVKEVHLCLIELVIVPGKRLSGSRLGAAMDSTLDQG